MKRGCIYSAAGVPRNLGEGAGNFRQYRGYLVMVSNNYQ